MSNIACVIPCYNLGRYLEQCVVSVLDQSRPFDEIIVIDDGSTDETPLIMGNLHPKVRRMRTKNQGYSKTRNLGMNMTDSEVIVFLDADDWLFSNYVSEVLPVFRQAQDIGIVCPEVETDGVTVAGGVWPAPHDDDLKRLGEQNYVWAASAVRRQALSWGGGFEAKYEPAADWALWYMIRSEGWRIRGVHKTLWHWRDRPDGLHMKIDDEEIRARMMQITESRSDV